MPLLNRRECAREIARKVAIRASSRHGVAHDSAANLQRTVRGLIYALRLNSTQGGQEFDRLEIGDRPSPEPWEDVVSSLRMSLSL